MFPSRTTSITCKIDQSNTNSMQQQRGEHSKERSRPLPPTIPLHLRYPIDAGTYDITPLPVSSALTAPAATSPLCHLVNPDPAPPSQAFCHARMPAEPVRCPFSRARRRPTGSVAAATRTTDPLPTPTPLGPPNLAGVAGTGQAPFRQGSGNAHRRCFVIVFLLARHHRC
jgi:hypothetical protein